MYEYRAKLVRVIDGDTVKLDVDLGHEISTKKKYRLLGINAPELKGETREAGQASKAYLEILLTPQMQLLITTVKDKTDKYGRYLVKIFRVADGVNINERMIQEGFAVRAEE